MPTADDVLDAKSKARERIGSWAWVHVGVAAMAMVATLPGRTHGLGLFTEPILASTGIGRETFGYLNLAATLIGSLFCLPCGWWIDRFGTRRVVTGVQLALAATVILMGTWTGLTGWTLTPFSVLLFITLTRGFGQSALSTASLALAGRTSPRQPEWMMAIFAVLVSLGFVVAFGILSTVIPDQAFRWQRTWSMIGVAIWVTAIVSWLLIRDSRLAQDKVQTVATDSQTLWTVALRSGVFWTFALGTAFYSFVAAGLTLFNQSLFADLGFDVAVFLRATILGIPVGLAANLAGGWAATRISLKWIFSASLWLFAAAMIWLPAVRSETEIYLYAGTVAAAGGVITVAYFSIWRRQFGTADLGKIQAAAQMLTVIFSAAGPAIFGAVRDRTGGYLPLFPYLSVIAAGLAVAAMMVTTAPPDRQDSR